MDNAIKTDILADIAGLLEGKAEGRYGLHDINQRQHALQGAALAERDGCPDALVAAALLHDVGHLVHHLGDNPAAAGVDDLHEEVGHAFLARWFGPEVSEPVRLHVAAKRYLCAAEPGYFDTLSKDSRLSLSLQGGPMSPPEMRDFERERYFIAAVQLRRYDDAAKVKDLATPPVAHFMTYVERCLRPAAG